MSKRQDNHHRILRRGKRRGDDARFKIRRCRVYSRGRLPALVGLLLALALLLPAVAGATTWRGKLDLDEEAPTAEVTTDRLIEESLAWSELPNAVENIALARVTLPPGVTATAVGGAYVFFVETGSLAVQRYARAYGGPGPAHADVPAGSPDAHAAGDQFLVPYDVASPPSITNEGSEPAIALVVSLTVSGSTGLEESLTGWSTVELLAVEEAVSVGPPLEPAGWSVLTPIAISLARLSYERGASHDILGPVARLLSVDAGAVNVLVTDAALFTRADAHPRPLPPTARVSLTPGDRLLVPGPGRLITRNVARGPSTVLVVTVSQIIT